MLIRKSRRPTYGQRNETLTWLGFESYAAYLASDLWVGVRSLAFATNGRTCRLCGETAEVIHHNSYTLAVLRGEDIKPLVPLCHPCHRKVEFKTNGKKRIFAKAVSQYNHLLRQRRKDVIKKLPAEERKHTRGFGLCANCGHKAKRGYSRCQPCIQGKPIQPIPKANQPRPKPVPSLFDSHEERS